MDKILGALFGAVCAAVVVAMWNYIVILLLLSIPALIFLAVAAELRHRAAERIGRASLSGWMYVPVESLPGSISEERAKRLDSSTGGRSNGRSMQLKRFDASQPYNQDSKSEQEFYNGDWAKK